MIGAQDPIERVTMVRPAGESSAAAAAAFRLLDLGLALVLLVALAPLLLVVALALRLEGGGPVIAHELRLGLDVEPFTMLTLRAGRRLRRAGLERVPQLWNVLRGDMSMVGPQAAVPAEVELYQPQWFTRFAVRPGLTGLWQVSGARGGGLAEMMGCDLAYVRKRSLVLNLRILARTPLAVLRRPRRTAPA